MWTARERARSLLGAALGILLAGAGTRMLFGAGSAYPWLVAPVGASALLLFTLPANPLAQPWPLIGGSFVSALLGICCAQLGAAPELAASMAVASAMAAMFRLNCLHPPGAALALSSALAAPALGAHAWRMVLAPLALNIAILLATALAYHRLFGQRYPDRAGARRLRRRGRSTRARQIH
jgi:CBS domain-containing membrane protein